MSEAAEFHDLVILFTLAVAAPLLARLARRIGVSAVVIEILLGMAVGPFALGWVEFEGVIESFAVFGLALLFFLAGFEIDPARLRGAPITRAGTAWVGSLATGLAIGVVLASTGVVIDSMLVGLTLTTTALGTLLPILRDRGEFDTPFGTAVTANGAVGEFGPIVAIGVLFAGDNPFVGSALLIGFLAIVIGVLLLTRLPYPAPLERVMRSGLHSSNQLPVRVCLLLVAVLVWVAAELGLDLLLGAFAAGLIVRYVLGASVHHDHDARVLSEKLEGIGFGVFIPIFFVSTGVAFDFDALFESPSTLLKVLMFLALLLLARGVPVWLVHRRSAPGGEAVAIALYAATALPLIVAITTVGVETDRMRPSNAAALVAAGMVSVLVFPVVAAAVRRGSGVTATRDEPVGL
jgi:Kef-type K+ transport system membrane component KefB